jgi:hypothetical protein
LLAAATGAAPLDSAFLAFLRSRFSFSRAMMTRFASSWSVSTLRAAMNIEPSQRTIRGIATVQP